ncbi:hypothetical protein GGR42_003267 [Saonia flava]|uniref:DUF4136 domain-containing protein n=1 Tax=Saonia flava TaxID=523696 RepID=A0A846QV12_9FLAO|nr:DUF4136 domain-containing protein [Saonia flava]NJB72776.1 hypothetical protein [Saonia flava]
MNRLVIFVFVLFLTACGAVHVNYDYDRETNFSNYTTYNYYPDIETGLSELDAKRLIKAIDSKLLGKGFLLSEEPEFYINILSDAYRNPSGNAVGVGVGGTGGNIGGGVSIGLPIGRSGIERQIQFDFIDSQKDFLFWQAVSESAYRDNASPNDREAILRQVVEKVFSKYPPRNK